MIIIDLHIMCRPNGKTGHRHTTIRKIVESDLVPTKGMKLEDPAWGDDDREIEEVTLNPTDNSYYIYTGDDSADSEQRCNDLEDKYIRNGWKRL